jgi:hypothetical protein
MSDRLLITGSCRRSDDIMIRTTSDISSSKVPVLLSWRSVTYLKYTKPSLAVPSSRRHSGTILQQPSLELIEIGYSIQPHPAVDLLHHFIRHIYRRSHPSIPL